MERPLLFTVSFTVQKRGDKSPLPLVTPVKYHTCCPARLGSNSGPGSRSARRARGPTRGSPRGGAHDGEPTMGSPRGGEGASQALPARGPSRRHPVAERSGRGSNAECRLSGGRHRCAHIGSPAPAANFQESGLLHGGSELRCEASSQPLTVSRIPTGRGASCKTPVSEGTLQVLGSWPDWLNPS